MESYVVRKSEYTIKNYPRLMSDIKVGDIYQITKPWAVRTNESKMLVMVVQKFKYYALCRPILFPSIYGMSKSYFLACVPNELKEENRVKSYEEVRKWIVNRPSFFRCDGLYEELAIIKEAFERRAYV